MYNVVPAVVGTVMLVLNVYTSHSL